MPTDRKVKAVQDMTEWLDGTTIVISTSYSGLPVTEMTALRRALREKDVSYKVVKNTLAYIAADKRRQSPNLRK